MSGFERIKQTILVCQRGSIFFPDDFSYIGGMRMISSALRRLCADNIIIRVAQGIYCYPNIDYKFGMGILFPSIDEIAKAIAKRDKCRIAPTGSHALNLLGLSAQLQANVVYYTDGSPRRIKVGNGRGILFKHSSEMKRFSFQNEMMQLLVVALREIGEKKVNENHKKELSKFVKNIDNKEFINDLTLAPAWVQKLLKELRRRRPDDDL